MNLFRQIFLSLKMMINWTVVYNKKKDRKKMDCNFISVRDDIDFKCIVYIDDIFYFTSYFKGYILRQVIHKS